jgi:hypothetical protein
MTPQLATAILQGEQAALHHHHRSPAPHKPKG